MLRIFIFIGLVCSLASAGLFNTRPLKDTAEVREAREVVAKWRGIVARAGNDGNKVTASEKIIKADRDVVQEVLKQGVSDRDLDRALKQIRILLDLAQVRRIIKTSRSDIARFGTYFNPRNQSKGKERFAKHYNNLITLLNFFSDLLKKYPSLRTNTPPLLVGMINTLKQGSNLLEDLKRYNQCFKTPDKPYCTRLAQKQSRGMPDEDEEYDDRDYDEDEDSELSGSYSDFR